MNSSPTIEQVDAAVQAVLGSLRNRRTERSTDTHAFAGRLLTERHVVEIDQSIRTITLGPGTVITPLAKDLLKRRGIAIRWLHQSVAEQAITGSWGFTIDGDSGLGASLRRALLAGTELWGEIEFPQAVDWVRREPDRGITVVTPRTALLVWKAHQAPGVRAASATDAPSLLRAINDLGINLLAIDPVGQTLFSIKHLCSVFRAQGAPSPPLGFETRTDHEDCRGRRPIDLFPPTSQPAPGPFSHHTADAFGRIARRYGGP